MGLCSPCSTALRQLRPGEVYRHPGAVVTIPRYCHTSVINCWICAKFAKWLDGADRDVFENWHKEALQVEYCNVQQLFVQGQNSVAVLFTFSMRPFRPANDGDSCSIEVNFVPSNAHEEPISRRFCSSRTDLDLIQTWFNKCTRYHKGCRGTSQSWFPTRLLHLGTRGRYIKLVVTENNPPKGPYMTLSHRWGPERYTKLQSSTITQLQRAINVARLPRSFQDAVRIARHIGIQYLWIDSLCIKQDKDDRSDWTTESRLMNKVYSSACLNISATRSTDSSDRLLGKSSWASKIPTGIELGADSPSKKVYVIDGDLWNDEVENGPLLRRGWVFQERFLARRIVHFGESQLAWECIESHGLGMFPDGLPFSMGVLGGKVSDGAPTTPASTPSTIPIPDRAFASKWQDLMRQYSKCGLTDDRDKLIALDGIAKSKIILRPGDKYAAGMWKSTALFDLPWRRWDEDRKLYPIEQTSARAPSWSWASVDGEIRFPLNLPESLSRLRECYAEVNDLVGHATDQNGNISGQSKMQLEGLCLPLRIHWNDMEEPSGFTVQGLHFSTGQGVLESSIYLEASVEAIDSLSNCGKLLLLPLFATTHIISGIVLAKTYEIGSHRRIGALEIEVMTEYPLALAERDDQGFAVHASRKGLKGLREEVDGDYVRTRKQQALDFMNSLHKQKAHSRLISIL